MKILITIFVFLSFITCNAQDCCKKFSIFVKSSDSIKIKVDIEYCMEINLTNDTDSTVINAVKLILSQYNSEHIQKNKKWLVVLQNITGEIKKKYTFTKISLTY